MRFPVFAVASHWAFQGLAYMDRSERRFKLGLDLFLMLASAVALGRWIPQPLLWLPSFLVAHTLNFLFNGHLWGVLKHYGLVTTSRSQFESYARGIKSRIAHEPSISSAAVYGSVARESWNPSSDLDLRLVRYPGFKNGLRACAFVLSERTRALIARFPLDIYVFDDIDRLADSGIDDNPLAVMEKDRLLSPSSRSSGKQ